MEYWKNFVTAIYEMKNDAVMARPVFKPPALENEIAHAESKLGMQFPLPLKDLLLETNGVVEMLWIQEAWIENIWLVWSAEQIAKENMSARNLAGKLHPHRDFDDILFFSNAGADGILFGFQIGNFETRAQEIVVWHPIENTLTTISPSLENFLESWLTGRIGV